MVFSLKSIGCFLLRRETVGFFPKAGFTEAPSELSQRSNYAVQAALFQRGRDTSPQMPRQDEGRGSPLRDSGWSTQPSSWRSIGCSTSPSAYTDWPS